ncbi:glycosyltransferase [Synoicihabitans lomoniglobus]|uniref:Glycosyltransferase n=1 Tax=Synoicihabitans lomoniglobus TaxID=2909285 RepID=A0AAF0CSR4_9BACT|nr:glycosyltransferase [Opitutaceae bacterium LMO-M01]WED67419.1 glycosyltransferase [Opitutaceae bacterium LMO-M01]
MIYFDVTKSAKAKQASGLMRVNRRLSEELGDAVTLVRWGESNPPWQPDDWYLTTETFDVAQRPGFGDFLERPPCRLAALFPDAIPLQHPKITWPHSVVRHPGYMMALAKFDHVFAISDAVKHDLTSYWQWAGTTARAAVSTLPLGADFDGSKRHPRRDDVPPPVLLCVGIVEPRKNQSFLLRVAEEMWARGGDFELHIVGRVNPHFGRPIAAEMRQITKRRPGFHFHEAATDEVLARLLARTRAVVFPTIAEGCGLPVLEALWRGLPCVCSDLPVLRENTEAGGCVPLPTNDLEAWTEGLQRLLTDDGQWRRLADVAAARPLPTWKESAAQIVRTLRA